MGKKTDKKIKSDRINALRKQYDSFLEEDKKRKERNDYILGRLDKMRYSNMVVQLHQAPPTNRDFLPPLFSRHSRQPEKLEPTDGTVDRINSMQMVHANQQISRPGYQSSQLDVPRNYLEEASILNEISKKYILIPKLKTTLPSAGLEAIPPPFAEPVSSIRPDIDSNDWQSKYDILKHLKKNEKEEIPKCVTQEPTSQLGNEVLQNFNNEEVITAYENELPVKDVTDQVGIENNLINDCVLSEQTDKIPISDGGRDLKAESFAQNNIMYRYVNNLGEKIEHGLQVEQYALAHEQNVQGVLNNDNTVEYEKSYPGQEFVQGVLNNDHTVEYQKSYPEQEYFQEELTNDNTVENPKTYTDQENVQKVSNTDTTVEYKKNYPEQNYVQENLTNDNTVENQKTYPNQEYIQKVSNIDNTQQEYQNAYPEQEYPIEYEQFIPEPVTNINGTEQEKAFKMHTEIPKMPKYNPDEAAILEFEQEPTTSTHKTVSDMVDGNLAAEITPTENSDAFVAGIEEFDAEQRELFHPNNADENYKYYEQDGTYNTEYTQDQNYPQSQEYAYYEGTEQEVQPVEINDHEETQQLYDPAYEQQYMSNYDQPQEEQQQPVYMEQDAQPLPEPNYDLTQIQDFVELSYGPQETVKIVDEVLAKEEGLVEVQGEKEPVVLSEM